MMMPGERKVLAYLRRHPGATVADVARACLPRTPPEWVGRIISNLDWLGYLAASPGPGGTAAGLRSRRKGVAAAGGRHFVGPQEARPARDGW
jgi:hypothetical protein